MKALLKILTFALLAFLIVGLVFAFIFFMVWQKNERPTVVNASWDQEEVLLGHSRTLAVTIRAPWHRQVTTARPVGNPEFLAPVKGQQNFIDGGLDLTGHRLWHYNIPLVATDTTSLEGKTITLPIKRTNRVGPNSVTIPLPDLAIKIPGSIPPDPTNPQEFLTEDPPPTEAVAGVVTPYSQSSIWPIVIAIALTLAIIYFCVRSKLAADPTPPWEIALKQLDNLTPNKAEPELFFSQLTDILKQYTAERYEVPARAKTSSEYIRDLKILSDIPEEHLDKLPPLSRLADGVKFAGLTPENDDAPRSHELVRSFVVDTTPQPTTESDDA